MLKRIKSLTKAVISPLVDHTGWYDRRLRRASAAPGAWTIVMYHRVIDDPRADPFNLGMCVMRHRFEAQIRYLRSRFEILTVGDAQRRLASGQALPERALSITFDDGYRDNLTHVLPVMQEQGVPFSIYVPTEGMDNGRLLWWDRMIVAMACATKPQLDLASVGLASVTESLSFTGVNGEANAEKVLSHLWDLDKEARERCMDLIEQALGPSIAPALMASRLRPHEVQQLHQAGVEIGAHSASHPNLELAPESLIRAELQSSRTELEDLLQAPVNGLAYPGGRVSTDAKRIARELGFAYALGTETGVNLPSYEAMHLRRIGMPSSDLPDVRRAVSQSMLRTKPSDQLQF